MVNYTSDSSKPKAQGVADDLQSTYGVKAIIAQADLSTVDGPLKLIETAKSALQTPKGPSKSTSSSTTPASPTQRP